MNKRLIRLGLVITAMVLFAGGCAPMQAALPAANTAITAPSLTDAPTVAPTTVPPAPTLGSASAPTAGGANNDTIRFVLVSDKSEARYRVREQLANIALPSDAIGRTKDFNGTLVIKSDGSIVSPDSKFTVNLATLTSDRSQRDNFIKRAVLQTNQYPNAVFVPTQATGLPSPLPQSGSLAFKLTGDLTIQNVTKPVTWDVTANLQGDQLTGQATTTFKFEDFSLTQPRVPVVLSIEDHITLELDFTMQRG